MLRIAKFPANIFMGIIQCQSNCVIFVQKEALKDLQKAWRTIAQHLFKRKKKETKLYKDPQIQTFSCYEVACDRF